MHTMRTSHRDSVMKLALCVLVAAGLVLVLAPNLQAVVTSGGSQTGVKVCKEFTEKNNSDQTATDLHFKAWQKEDDRHINGWRIEIDCCNDATSERSTQPDPYNNDGSITHAVDVNTSPGDCNVPPGGLCRIKVCFWLTKSNTIRMADFTWTYDSAPDDKGEPDNGFSITCPGLIIPGTTVDIWGAGDWRHSVIFSNDDASRSIRILDLGFSVDSGDVSDLLGLSVTPGPTPDILLGPGDQYRIDVVTPDPMIGQYIYAKWSLTGLDQDSVYAAAVALQHEIADCETKVPSMTGWGFILFGALIILTGAYYVWRRRRLVAA